MLNFYFIEELLFCNFPAALVFLPISIIQVEIYKIKVERKDAVKVLKVLLETSISFFMLCKPRGVSYFMENHKPHNGEINLSISYIHVLVKYTKSKGGYLEWPKSVYIMHFKNYSINFLLMHFEGFHEI